MSKIYFSSLHVNGMSINNVYSLIKSSIEITIPVQSSLSEIVNAALNQLMIDNQNFGEQINKNQKSGLTEDLKLLDKSRNGTDAEIKRTVTFYLKGDDEMKKTFAQKLKLFLTPYWDIAALPLNTKTGITSEMIRKYNFNPELIEAARNLGIEMKFGILESKNNTFDIIYKSRNNEAFEHRISGSSLKPAAVESYNTFCTVMEQVVNLTPNDQIIALFYKLDDYRKKYHAMQGGKDTPPTPESK